MPDAGYLLFFLPLLLPVLSFTVVFGLRLTVDCLTNLPVEALRPRFPADEEPLRPGMPTP